MVGFFHCHVGFPVVVYEHKTINTWIRMSMIWICIFCTYYIYEHSTRYIWITTLCSKNQAFSNDLTITLSNFTAGGSKEINAIFSLS